MHTSRELATLLAALRHWQRTHADADLATFVFAWPQFSEERPLSHAEIDALCERLSVPCDCERPGPFWCGIPGILARVVHGRIDPASVERCDACERYPSDEAARERLRELMLFR